MLLTALRRAGTVCRHVQSRLDALRSMVKDDASPVTIADFAAQAVVARALRSARLVGSSAKSPGPGLVAEESAAFFKHPTHAPHLNACVAALRESGAWVDATPDDVIDAVDLGSADPACLQTAAGGWTLDPVDGTKGFLRGQQYCVSLARIQRGTPTLGFLVCPNRPHPPHPPHFSRGSLVSVRAAAGASDEPAEENAATQGLGVIVLARADQPGVHLIPLGLQGAQAVDFEALGPGFLRPALEAGRPARLAESVESAHTNQSASARILEAALARPPEVLRLDSQVKYALLACNQADVYLRLPSRKGYVERIWDHAAGTLIAQASGCMVSDARGDRLDFSKGKGLEANQGIVAAPAELHASIINALASDMR